MGFQKKTVKDVSLAGKTVLLRADYNVPQDKNGHITSDYRIQKSLPTVQYLLDQHCKVIICSHLGRPKGPDDKQFSLSPVAKLLEKLLKRDVHFVGECVGPKVITAVAELRPGQVLLLENLRFHTQEEANDKDFAKQLASVADVFVQDGFGVVHRAHASTEGVTHFLPSVAGLLLEQEVNIIEQVIHDPKRPLMAILGGAKISDKIEILERFIDIADFVAIGGAMSNTFLLSQGIAVGDSLIEKDDVGLAKDIIERARAKSKKQKFVFYIPQDGVVAKEIDGKTHTRIVDWDVHVIADIENYPQRPPKRASTIAPDEKILDIGPFSGAFISGGMQMVSSVIWNGTMGVTEVHGLQGPIGPFAHGTERIVDAMLGEYGNKPFTLVGGGDTASYVEEQGLVEQFNHVSTGGGASMELMSGKKLPGVEALQNK
ncbi:MAG: Phosphoglycerate kinase [Candidatus Saccharibacteria bacterium]|nr:Phosphoglycerate kinase [Candidatus Saccharibacteria bacterium]